MVVALEGGGGGKEGGKKVGEGGAEMGRRRLHSSKRGIVGKTYRAEKADVLIEGGKSR